MIEVYIDPQNNEEYFTKEKEKELKLKTYLSSDVDTAESPTKLPKVFDVSTLGYSAMVTWNDKKVSSSDNILRQKIAPSSVAHPHKIHKYLSIPSGRKEVK